MNWDHALDFCYPLSCHLASGINISIDTDIGQGGSSTFFQKNMNPLKELRRRLGATREDMGKLLGLSAPSVDKYESEMSPETARLCVQICQKNGEFDLIPEFRRIAGDLPSKGSELDQSTWSPRERELIVSILEMLRAPVTATDRNLADYISDAVQLRRRIKQNQKN